MQVRVRGAGGAGGRTVIEDRPGSSRFFHAESGATRRAGSFPSGWRTRAAVNRDLGVGAWGRGGVGAQPAWRRDYLPAEGLVHTGRRPAVRQELVQLPHFDAVVGAAGREQFAVCGKRDGGHGRPVAGQSATSAPDLVSKRAASPPALLPLPTAARVPSGDRASERTLWSGAGPGEPDAFVVKELDRLPAGRRQHAPVLRRGEGEDRHLGAMVRSGRAPPTRAAGATE